MSLSERDRARYARHLLLSQLGEAGQARLLAARVTVAPDLAFAPEQAVDVGVLEVARTYLTRAGVQVLDDDADGDAAALTLPSRAEVARVAGSPALHEATRALLGALAAVDAIKHAAGLPDSPRPSPLFVISSEEA